MHKLKQLYLILIVMLSVEILLANTDNDMKTMRYFAEYDQRPIESHIVKIIGEKELVLLVCKPDGWSVGDKRSALIWVHGGGWVSGGPDLFNAHMKYTASRGAVAFSLQYRLMTSKGYRDNKKLSKEENQRIRQEKFDAFMNGPSLTDCIEDVKDAVKFIKENANDFGIDPNKLASIGDSAGSHLATCLGTVVEDEYKVNAVVACSSISDLSYEFGRDFVKPSEGYEEKDMEEDQTRLSRAKSVSPYFNITAGTPPILILDGGKDWLGDEPKRFYDKLKASGVNVDYKHYPQAKHAFIVYGYSASLEEITQTLVDIDEFLVKHEFLEGLPTIKMPEISGSGKTFYESSDMIVGEKVINFEIDTPPFFSISMNLKLPEKFNGELVSIAGKWGIQYKINNKGHDLTFLRGRLRGKQDLFKSGVWQNVIISVGPDKLTIEVDGKKLEVENSIKSSFAGNQLTFLKKIDGEIKDLKIVNK